MANPDIGLIDCPCCDFTDAHVRETVKKKTYIVCDECASQTFARGMVSDASIRRRMRPVAAVQPDPAPNTMPEKAPKRKAAVPPAPTFDKPPANEDLKTWLNL